MSASPEQPWTGTLPGGPFARSLVGRIKRIVVRPDRPLFALFQSVGTQALITLINILTGVVSARMLGPEGRGIYAAVSTWPQFFATLAMAGLNSGIVYRMRKTPQQSGALAGAALALCLLASALALAAGVALVPHLMVQYSPAVIVFSQLCLLSIFINSTQVLIKQSFAGAGEFARCNLANLLPQALYLATLLLMCVFVSLTPQNAVLALLGSGVLALLAALPGYVRQVRPRFAGSLRELPKLLSYSARAWPIDGVFTIATYTDRLVLIPLLTPRELGLYAVAFSFSRLVLMTQPAILSVVFPHMSGSSATRRTSLHGHAVRFLLIALLGGCLLLWLTGATLLSWAYGAEFVAANGIFRLLILEASLSVLSQVTAQLFLADDRPGVVSMIQLAVLGGSFVLLLTLVPHYGATGAALALAIAALCRWMLFMGAAKLILHAPLPRLYLVRDDLRYLAGLLK